jgi:predicted phosphodiesterase
MIESLSKRSLEHTDVVISAHTHIPEIKQGNPMYINPGECSGWLYGKNTVAVLDLQTMHAEIVDLSEVSLDII